jgi:hypothetical protein
MDGEEAHLIIHEPPQCDVLTARTVLVAGQPLISKAKVLWARTPDRVIAGFGAEAVIAWKQAHADELDLATVELVSPAERIRRCTDRASASNHALRGASSFSYGSQQWTSPASPDTQALESKA